MNIPPVPVEPPMPPPPFPLQTVPPPADAPLHLAFLHNRLQHVHPAFRFSPTSRDLVELLTRFIAAGFDHPDSPVLSFWPIHLHLHQITNLPSDIRVPAVTLNTGKSLYMITKEPPVLSFPCGSQWVAGRRQMVPVLGAGGAEQQIGWASSYVLVDPSGAEMKWSMEVLGVMDEDEPRRVVKFTDDNQ